MAISDYDWQRLKGLGFDLNFVEKSAKLSKPTKKSDLAPMDKMAMAPALSKTPAVKPSTFIMGESVSNSEPNGGMLISQLATIMENAKTALSLMTSDSNAAPWVASKISEASHSLTAVADYLKHGDKE